MGLTSKKEGNCNVMIEGPADYGLHVSYQLHPFVLKFYMPWLYLPRHCYELFFVPPHCCYNLISLVPTWLHISTNSFWNRSLTCHMWAEAVRFDRWLTKTICRPMPFWTRPDLTLEASTSAFTRPSWRQSYIAMSCVNNARIEGLDVTLDDPAGFMRTDPGEWSDVSAWFIRGWIPFWTAYTSEGIVRDCKINSQTS